MKKIIYLDNAATTPVRKEVIEAMKPYWNVNFGNPSSITKLGVMAKKAVQDARQIIANVLLCRSPEIIYTSGGTESNNLAIFGVVKNLKESGIKISDMHFITTNIEHSSISECFEELRADGAQVDLLPVTENGLINLKDLRKALKPNTVLISIGYANNEIGVIQPIREIAKEVRHARKSNSILAGQFPYFHTDASQAGLYLDLNINQLGVDFMTLDGQKIYGPKGMGVLFVRSGVKISPIILGGGQENNLRSGTENVPLIAGLAKAFELVHGSESPKALGVISPPADFCGRAGSAVKRRELSVMNIKKLRDYFWQKIKKEIATAVLNGDMENRLPNNLNISIPGIDSEFAVLCLDEEGIVCSTKSACNYSEDGSFVVRALYSGHGQSLSETLARSTLRFSLGENIKKNDIDYVVDKLKVIVQNQLNQNLK